jgi:hypothetical protein
MSIVADRASEKVANYAAVGFSASHWWLPSLNHLSEIAADLLPIAGLVWLLFQFALKVYDRWVLHQKDD